MIEIKKEELLKNSIDYEDYSENICVLSIDELRKEGLIKCGGCSGCKCDGSKCISCNKKKIVKK